MNRACLPHNGSSNLPNFRQEALCVLRLLYAPKNSIEEAAKRIDRSLYPIRHKNFKKSMSFNDFERLKAHYAVTKELNFEREIAKYDENLALKID
jgi:hypothetical protein